MAKKDEILLYLYLPPDKSDYMPHSVHNMITAAAGILIGVMAVCLLTVRMPRDGRLLNYRISRRMLALGYFVLSAACFLALCIGISHKSGSTDPMVKTVTLITGALQALMYQFTILTLINPMFPTFRKIMRSAVPITAVAAVVACSYVWGGEEAFRWTFSVAWVLYFVLLVIFIRMFRKEYADYETALHNYFSEDDGRHLRWIRTAYILAQALGFSAGISLALKSVSFAVFMSLLTVFYVYFAIRYISYGRSFWEMAPALEPLFEEVDSKKGDHANIPALINDWIGKKGFAEAGVTMDNISDRIGVDRTLLAFYINRVEGKSFRRWITGLRVEEAREKIMENPRMPLSEVSDAVGIRGRRMFFSSFRRFTGEDVRDFRDRMLKVVSE